MTTRQLLTLVFGLLAIALLAWMAWWLGKAAAQEKACTPYLLCPYPSGGTGGRSGAGGVAGAGTGGRAGTGARGGSGGSAGQPPSGLTITAALALGERVVNASTGGRQTGSVSYGNNTAASITTREIRIAARAPGASHEGGPFTDLEPVLTNVVLAPGQSITLNATRTFKPSDTVGQWEAYSTHQDAAGKWHDGPSEHFSVIAKAGPTPPPTGAMSVGSQSWYIAPWAGTHLFKSNVNWSTAYANGDDIWNPTFIAELQGLSTFRHMDSNATNFSKISSWSQRKQPNDPRNQEVYIDGSSSSDTTGLAIEWQVDLCNRANVDCWFSHPYLANDDYFTQQAQLVKAKLSPSLKIYIELSNEVWNGSFSAFQQAIDAGRAGGLPGGNQYYQGIAHEMFRALQMYQIYQNVFGASAMGTRVIRVFSESGNLDLTTQAFNNVYKSSQWNPQGQRIDALMLAPYIGNGVDGSSEKLSRWQAEVDAKVNDPIGWVKQNHAAANNIAAVGCYEAGMHHLQNADAWARNPASYDAYVYMLDKFATKLNAVCCLYTAHGTWEPKGAWGLRDHVGQPASEAHKARATSQWIAGTATRASDTRVIILVVIILIVVVVILFAVFKRERSTTPPPPKHDDKS